MKREKVIVYFKVGFGGYELNVLLVHLLPLLIYVMNNFKHNVDKYSLLNNYHSN